MTTHRAGTDRRRQVGEALIEVVAEHGLRHTTLRRVADVAGVSVGLVQRYFASKDELLQFGFDYVYQRTHDRIDAVPITHPVKEVVIGIAETLLPLDLARQRECRVWLAFVHAALNDPALLETHHTAAHETVAALRTALIGAQRSGELNRSVDVDSAALELASALDGLTLSGTASRHLYSVDTLRILLRRQVDQIFAEAPR